MAVINSSSRRSPTRTWNIFALRSPSRMGLLAMLLNSAGIAMAQFFQNPSQQQQQQRSQWDYGQHFLQPQQNVNTGFTTQQNFNPYDSMLWPQQQFNQAPPQPYARFLPSTNQQRNNANFHQLPYASYRQPAATVDETQRERLARIAAESESFSAGASRPSPFGQQNSFLGQNIAGGGGDGFQRMLATVVEKLPKIAETMANLGGANKEFRPTSAQTSAAAGETLQPRTNGFDSYAKTDAAGGALTLPRREYGIGIVDKEHNGKRQPREEGSAMGHSASLIDSMPEPSSLFSFNKLLSAFGGARSAGGTADTKALISPMLKSVDGDPESVQKSVKEEDDHHLTPPPQIPAQSAQNPFEGLLKQFGLPNLMSAQQQKTTPSPGEVPNPGSKASSAQKQPLAEDESNNNGDLFGSLMKGKLPQMPDWLRSFGLDQMFSSAAGANGTKIIAPKLDDGSPGNALAQLFGGAGGGKLFGGTGGGGNGAGRGFALSSVLGSGLDDAASPRKRR